MNIPIYYCPEPKKQPETDRSPKLDWRLEKTADGYQISPPPAGAPAIAAVTPQGKKYRLISTVLGVDSIAPTLEACVLCLAIKSYGRGWN